MAAQPTAPVWEGVFAEFAEARGEDNVFEGGIWLDKLAERAHRALASSRGGAIPPVAVTTDYALPAVAALAVPREEPLKILDFGGGLATSYVPLRAMLPRGFGVEFTVVENEMICRAGEALFAGDAAVRFLQAMPGPPTRFDIVHFGSSIQYVDDWRGLLAAAGRLEPTYLLFADLPAADNRTFVTAQLFHGRRIPVRFWNLDEFVRAVESLGYALRLRSRYRGSYLGRDGELPTANFDEAHRLTYTSQLVFRRTGPDGDGSGGERGIRHVHP